MQSLYYIVMESSRQEAVNNFVADEATLAALRFQELYKEKTDTEETSRQLVECTLPQLNDALQGILGHRNQYLVEDIIQQTYERAFKDLHKGNFEGKSQVSTWLYRIMFNRLGAYFYKESKRNDIAPMTPLDENVGLEIADSVNVEEDAIALILAKRIDQIVANLNISDRDRNVWDLIIKQSEKYAEVALITGLSVGLLKVIIHRIRNKVRTALDE